MKIKIKKVGNTLDKRISKLQDLNGEKVAAGWFEEQGFHTPSGLSYVDLARIHSNGISVPARPILDVVKAIHHPRTDKRLKKALQNWLANIDRESVDMLLDDLGEAQRENIRQTMGLPIPALRPTENNPDPLVDTGEWRAKTAYKTSKDNVAKTSKL